ncbi:MAG: hypothetical protein R6V21_10950 [Pelovirga sp.]
MPQCLLRLTATPDRIDRSDILSLCDDNLLANKLVTYGRSKGAHWPSEDYVILEAREILGGRIDATNRGLASF